MKYIIVSIFFLLLINSCDSNPVSPDESQVTVENLAGKWLWKLSIADDTGETIRPSVNNRRMIMITQDSVMREYQNDTLIFVDKFRIIKAMTRYSPDSLNVIDFISSKRFNYIVIHLNSNSLLLGYGYPGYRQAYSKLN